MSRPHDTLFVLAGVPEQHWSFEPMLPRRRRRRPKVSQEVRELVFARDFYTCVDCGATGGLTIDHVKPLSKGGANHPNNMETRCLECNLRKGAR